LELGFLHTHIQMTISISFRSEVYWLTACVCVCTANDEEQIFGKSEYQIRLKKHIIISACHVFDILSKRQLSTKYNKISLNRVLFSYIALI